MRKNYFLKCAVVAIAALFSFSATFAQDGPKIVNLTELLTPVAGENAAEPFQFTFQSGAAWGDFDNDGFLDLITSGVYSKLPDFDESDNPIPNVDEDGIEIPLPDPLYDPDNGNLRGNWIKSTKLYKNNGDGTFTKVAHPFPHFDKGGFAWLDYDNDGNLDVFIAGNKMDGERYSGLWRNLGNGEFEEVFPGSFEYFDYESGNRPSRIIAAGDYDNDGWVDLAFIGRKDGDWEEGRMVSLYRNLGGEDFLKVDNPVRGEKPFVQQNGGSIAWGDYNNDGFLDLICFGYISGTDAQKGYYTGDDFTHGGVVCLYTNNGDGTFAEPKTFPAGEDGQIAWGDYNNDGKLDFIYANYSWWPEPNGGWRFDFFENNGNSTFTSYNNEQAGLPGTQSVTVDWGDINNDGYEDFVALNTHPAAVFLNNAGKLPFVRLDLPFDVEGQIMGRDVRGGTVSFIDFDNDGDLDVFANGYDDTNKRAHLLRNDLDVEEGIPANQAPTAPANLQATTDDEGVTTFTWNASTDDLTPQAALRYNLYVKQGNVIKSVLPVHLTTGRLKVNETLAPIMGTTYKMSGLEGSYEWGVQAIDNGKMASAFSKINTGIANINKAGAIKAIGKKQAVELKADNALQGTVQVYSISGMSVYSKAGQINGTTIALPAGVYIVKTVSVEGTSVDKVIVK